jgi:gliding motility associated protien GldN
MNRLCYVIALCVCISLGIASTASAQEMASGFNPNSVHPVHESNILWQKTLWRRMDLNEKQNMPFFAKNNEITKIIIEAVELGLIHPYTSDSLTTQMTKEQFMENLELPNQGGFEEEATGFETGGWGEEGETEEKPEEPKTLYFLPTDVTVLELKEDMLFDRKRSRVYFDIQSITLVIPGTKFETGLQRQVGSFRYKDLVQLFKSQPKEAIWYNPYNAAQHRNLADAFELRLFHARLIKLENPDDEYLVEQYSQSRKAGINASQRAEYELIEKESELWEY